MDCLVELLLFFFGKLPGVLVFAVLFGPSALHVEGGLDEHVIGVECCGCVGGHVVNHGFPGSRAQNMIWLVHGSVGLLVGPNLCLGLDHPGLWETEVVCLANPEALWSCWGCRWGHDRPPVGGGVGGPPGLL